MSWNFDRYLLKVGTYEKSYRTFVGNAMYVLLIRVLLGAQLSSRCLWIDGSSSKFWSILTYPKRHESSLDIFEEKGGWSASRSLRRCFFKWNNVSWLIPSLQRRWFRCWRPSVWRKAKNLWRRWCYLLWAVETEWNHHWETVSNAIDAVEPSTARETAQYE